MRLFMGVLAFIILPLAALADAYSRYQAVSDGKGGIYVVDGKTGYVKHCSSGIGGMCLEVINYAIVDGEIVPVPNLE